MVEITGDKNVLSLEQHLKKKSSGIRSAKRKDDIWKILELMNEGAIRDLIRNRVEILSYANGRLYNDHNISDGYALMLGAVYAGAVDHFFYDAKNIEMREFHSLKIKKYFKNMLELGFTLGGAIPSAEKPIEAIMLVTNSIYSSGEQDIIWRDNSKSFCKRLELASEGVENVINSHRAAVKKEGYDFDEIREDRLAKIMPLKVYKNHR